MNIPELLFDFGDVEQVVGLPEMDMCSCSECGWKGKVSDCESATEQDGWESAEYLVHICPNCEDGTIGDYWPSEESLVAAGIKE